MASKECTSYEAYTSQANIAGKLQSPNYKLDWYQNENQVVISIMAKNLDPEKFFAKFSCSGIDIKLIFKDGIEVEKTINLSYEVIPDQCKYKFFSTKVEMRLLKKSNTYWTSFEKFEKPQPQKKRTDWQKYVSEIDDETLEDDIDLRKALKQMYDEGSDDVKKAMNKSFLESKGTVLNTNWEVVSKEKIGINPPEGSEWRPWDK